MSTKYSISINILSEPNVFMVAESLATAQVSEPVGPNYSLCILRGPK